MAIWTKAVSLATALTVLMAVGGFEGECEKLRPQVFRLHILAQSDAEEDQRVKLAVRDAVLEQAGDLFGEAASAAEAEAEAAAMLPRLTEIANGVLKAEGAPYEATAAVTTAWFPTRTYGDATLPAGNYRALEIKLGEAAGHNWWCVLFPPLCVSAATAVPLDPSGERVMNGGRRFAVRFKIVEWVEKARRRF